MSNTTPNPLAQWKDDFQKLRAAAPDVARAFGGLHVAMMKPGNLSSREKELIALAVGMVQGCTDCIWLHAEASVKAGATREQVLEAAGVAVLMGGGPTFVHMPDVLKALDHLQAAPPTT